MTSVYSDVIKYHKLVTTCLLLFLFTKVGWGKQFVSQQRIFVTQYGVEQGLRQSMVRQVCQDYRGLMWLVTGDGLQCFDGDEFRTFRIASDAAFSDNIMREIVEYKPGYFAISTASSIVTFDSRTGTFNTLRRKKGSHPRILNLMIDDRVFCWWPDLGYCLIEGNRFNPIKLNFTGGNRPPGLSQPISALTTHSGQLLIQTEKGVIILQRQPGLKAVDYQARWVVFPMGCQGMAKSPGEEVYFLSGNQVLKLLDPAGRTQILYENDFSGNFLHIDRNQNFWITNSTDQQIFLINKGVSEYHMFTSEGKYTIALSPSIIRISDDKQGNLWFCTDGLGVIRYSPGEVRFTKSTIGFTRCLLKKEAFVYAGTFHNGLWKLSEELTEAKRILPSVLKDDLYFLDLATDRVGRIWAATDKGIFVLGENGTIQFKYSEQLSSAKFILSHGDSIVLSADGRFLSFKTSGKPTLSSDLPSMQIRHMLKVGSHFWLASPFGLYRSANPFDYRSYQHISKQVALIQSPSYCSVFEQDIIWVATEQGILCFSPDGKLKQDIDFLNTLKDELVYSLVPDSLGRIWFAGSKGIGCILANRKKVIRFSQQNNLQSLEFNSNAFLADNKSKIYFGGINGVNGINTNETDFTRTGPIARLSLLMISDTIFSKGIPAENPELRLNRQAANISGKVFISDFLKNGMEQFSFYLKGYQHDWSEPTKDPHFNYRNLPPGRYQLWAKASDSFQNEGSEICLLRINIPPPFWKSSWFLILLAISMILTTYLVVKKIQRIQFLKQLRALERQNFIDKERLRISRDMHDEVGASLTRISILSQLVKGGSQEPEKVHQIIGQINEIAGGVVDEMSEIIWAINPRNDDLPSFCSYLRRHVTDYLEPNEIAWSIDFPDEIPSLPMSSELRRNTFLTVKEALHNIVKHAEAKTVWIELKLSGEIITIIIRDNGRGFIVNSTFGKGNGLANMQKRIGDLGGTYELSSEPGMGTVVTLKVKIF